LLQTLDLTIEQDDHAPQLLRIANLVGLDHAVIISHRAPRENLSIEINRRW
jgi:hypothetical protein